ncbi:MAG: hypothetical protein ACI9W1_003523, partial [Candidatus Azotimanducaceae bacterium]
RSCADFLTTPPKPEKTFLLDMPDIPARLGPNLPFKSRFLGILSADLFDTQE